METTAMCYETIYNQNAVQIYRLNDKVYYRVGNLEKRRQCNGGFILLKDCTIAIDVPSTEGAKEMLYESEKLFGLPVKYAFLTHAHPDHDLGLPVFADTGDITLFAGANVPIELEKQEIRYPEKFVGINSITELTFEGTKIVLECIGVTAHSPWDMLIYLPEYDIMFTGDLVACEPILYLESCCLHSWVDVLRDLRKRNILLLARGHGGCEGSKCIDREIDYLVALSSVNNYMRENVKVSEQDINDEFMGTILRGLCDSGSRDAKLLYETSGSAAYYQLTQFYRYEVKS